MSRAYAYEMLRRHDTHICQEVGFNSINGTPKENTKRLFDHAELPINKKPRLEPCIVRSVREMSSVQMTLDGLLIAFREGILPKPWPLDKPFNNLFDESEDETQHSDENLVPILDQFENQSNSDINQNEQIMKTTMDYSSFHNSLPKYLLKSKYSKYLQNYLAIPSPVVSKYFKRPVSNVSVNKITKPSNQKHINSQVTLTNKLNSKKLAKPLTNSVISNKNRTLNGITQEKERNKKLNKESSNKYSSEHQSNNTGPINSKLTKPVLASTTQTKRFTSLLKSPTVSFPDTNRKIFVEEKRDLEGFQEEVDSLIVTPKINKSATHFVIETKENVVNNKEALDFNSEMDLSLQEAVVTDDESEFLTCVPMSTILPLELCADTNKASQLPKPGVNIGNIGNMEIENEIKNFKLNQLAYGKSQNEIETDKMPNSLNLKSNKVSNEATLPPFPFCPPFVTNIPQNKAHTPPSSISVSFSVISQETETETLNDVKSKPHKRDKKNKSGTIGKKDKKDKRKDLKEKKYKVYSNKNHDQITDGLVPKITIKINSNISISSEPTPELSQPADKASGPLPTPFYFDDQGNKIWVCPACVQPDDGSPMIGCDSCDDWYHWVCVGIMEDPGATVDWFCKPCLDKRNGSISTDIAPTGKKPGKKVKTHKVKH